MGNYDDLLTEDTPAPTGKYSDLLQDEPTQGKYADLLEGSDQEQSSTPETDKAVKETGFQSFMKGLDLKSVPGDIAKTLAGPLVDVPHALKEAYDVVRGVPIEQAVPESQKFVGIEKKPLEERLKVGLDTVTQLAFAKQLGEPLKGGEISDAIKPSNAQMETRETPLREQARPAGEVPSASSSDYAQRETQGEKGSVPQEVIPETARVQPSEETPTEDIKYTGVANRVYERLKQEGQLDEVPSGAGRSTADSIAIGRKRLQEGADPYAIASRFWKTRRISDTEFAVLRAQSEQLHGESLAAEKVMQADPTPENVAKYEESFQSFHDFSKNVVQPAKTATSNIFRAMQDEEPIHVDSYTGVRSEFNRINGRDIAPAERPVFERAAEDVQTATKERNGEVAKVDAELKKASPKSTKVITNDDLRNHIADVMKKKFPCQ